MSVAKPAVKVTTTAAPIVIKMLEDTPTDQDRSNFVDMIANKEASFSPTTANKLMNYRS